MNITQSPRFSGWVAQQSICLVFSTVQGKNNYYTSLYVGAIVEDSSQHLGA